MPFAVAALAATVLAACGGDSDNPSTPTTAPDVQVLSGRADMVTGGNALVEVALPQDATVASMKVSLNGRDVTASLAHDVTSNRLKGVIAGLAVGANELVAEVGPAARRTVTLTNFPATGPVFSGPHQTPFICQTAQFRIYPGGPFVGAATDSNCSVPTRVDYVYRANDNTFKPLDLQAALPADLRETTTKNGIKVRYIVRLETGTINRAIYQTAMLHDPKTEGAPSATGDKPKGWNSRLVYPFGGGCGSGWHVQGSSTGGVLNDQILSQGYGVASASLNVFGTNCNDVLSAETVMMVKERFIENYGKPQFTIGWSCSGAAMQQYMISDNYPGLLDGIIPSCSFPDPSNPASSDARLLHNYYNNLRGVPWSQQEITSASGYWGYNHIVNQSQSWSARLDTIAARGNGYPSALFNSAVPASLRFDPVTNPTGIRPTHWDHTVNVFGRDPANGFARRAMDNVGVQYGLGALNDGRISKEQFLDLNEKVGGFDINGTFTTARTQGDTEGIRLAYETGRVMLGQGGLGSTPIIDWDQIDTEEAAGGDLHLKFFHHMTRARLEKAQGNADNMVIWNGGSIDPTFVGGQAIAKMDEWLSRIAADTATDTQRAKVIRNRPAALADGCWRPAVAGGDPVFIAERQFLGTRGTSQCNSLYPGYSYPRGVAGESAASDVVKCQLKPVGTQDYRVTFTALEFARLRAIFPDGLCDFTRQGIAQNALAGTWLRFPTAGQYRKDGGS